MKMKPIIKKKVVVVGGSSGVGLATSRILDERGFAVTAVARNPGKLKDAIAGTAIQGITMDAQSHHAVRDFFSVFGPLDHLVITLSGAKGAGTLQEVSAETLREGFEAKVFAHWRIAQAAAPNVSPDGSITFVSSISARNSTPGTAGLAAINGAIESMIKPLARELKPRRVNAVSPGVVETPWWDALPAAQRDALLRSTAQASAVGRNGRAEEIAEAIAFLITNQFVTGTVIEIDGGLRLG